MRESLTVLASAKINLGLRVYPKRDDGFHNVQSIFTTVNLCDSITVRLLDEKSKIDCCLVDCPGLELPKENTFTKAYKAFCVLTGIRQGLEVHVDKKIPAGGGLGGGSSDSSSFIKSIDHLFSTNLKESDLDMISSQVGSDVFFFTKALFSVDEDFDFTRNRFSALVTGRGENISTIESRNDFSVLLVFPGEFVSTPMAYSLVDSWKEKFGQDEARDGLEEIYRRSVKDWTFVNDFTSPVLEKYPKISYALEDLKSVGADFCDMSGSGATVFGVFEDKDRALYAQKILDKKWRTVLA